MKRIVVDTNVFLNAFFEENYVNDERILDLEEEGKVKFITSTYTQNELYKVMARLVERENVFHCRDMFKSITGMMERSRYIKTPRKTLVLSNDPADQKFLDLAVEAKADYLITNDYRSGLLDLSEFGGVKITTPKGFIKEYEKKKEKTFESYFNYFLKENLNKNIDKDTIK